MVEHANSKPYVCPDCNTDVSFNDEICPKCGAIFENQGQAKKGFNYLAIIAFCSIFLVILITLWSVLYFIREGRHSSSLDERKKFIEKVPAASRAQVESILLEYSQKKTDIFKKYGSGRESIYPDLTTQKMKDYLLANAKDDYEKRIEMINTRMMYVDKMRAILSKSDFEIWFYLDQRYSFYEW